MSHGVQLSAAAYVFEGTNIVNKVFWGVQLEGAWKRLSHACVMFGMAQVGRLCLDGRWLDLPAGKDQQRSGKLTT